MSAASGEIRVFDRKLMRLRRDRAARRGDPCTFLFDHVGEILLERLGDVRRDFAKALNFGARFGRLAGPMAAVKNIDTLVHMDPSPDMARHAGMSGWPGVAADEEALPFGDGVFDLAIGNLSLHWVNDLPGALIQLQRSLAPDGLLLATMLGGETLKELRQALMAAELAVSGGASPRVSPLADVRDLGALLQRAGFALPVVDADRLTVTYDTVYGLLGDLRAMGETNAVVARNPATTRRSLWHETAQAYHDRFADPDGRIRATFEIITLTGWAPHPSQPQPLRPGSATTRLADTLGTQEIPAGDEVGP